MPAPLNAPDREKASASDAKEAASAKWAAGETVEFDYVVIGSGSAGSPVAARLAEAFPRKTVLMLEAGISNNHPMVQCPFRMFDLIGSPFDWQYKTKPMPLADGRVMDWPRGKTLGGSSSINGILWVRNAKEDYDYWGNELGLEGWGWDDVLPYFIKMENVHGPSSEERGKEGPVDVTAFVKDQVNPFSQMFVESCHNLPNGEPPHSFYIPPNSDYNTGKLLGASLAQNNCYLGIRSDTYNSYFTKRNLLEKAPGLTVLTNAEARKIHLTEDNAVSHVEVLYSPPGLEPRTIHIKAREETVLCAGAINTPILLLHSGIGPKAELEAAGIDCIVDLPDVGKNMMDHLYVSLFFETKPLPPNERGPITTEKIEAGLRIWEESGGREGDLTVGPTEAVAFFDSGLPDSDGRCDCEIEFFPSLWEKPEIPGLCFVSEVVGSRSKGELKIVKGVEGEPELEIHPEYFTDDRDLRVLVRSLQASRRIAATEPMADKVLREYLDPDLAARYDPFNEEEKYLEALARKTCITVYHPACTAAMGKVVDARLQVKGVKGLRIADASVMPRIVAGNTNAPSIMIGEKCAAMIIEDAAK